MSQNVPGKVKKERPDTAGAGRQRKREGGRGEEEMLCRVQMTQDPRTRLRPARGHHGWPGRGPGGLGGHCPLSDLRTSGRGALFAGGAQRGTAASLGPLSP